MIYILQVCFGRQRGLVIRQKTVLPHDLFKNIAFIINFLRLKNTEKCTNCLAVNPTLAAHHQECYYVVDSEG